MRKHLGQPGFVLTLEEGFYRCDEDGDGCGSRLAEGDNPSEARRHCGVAPNEIFATFDEAIRGARGRDRCHHADPGREALRPGTERAEHHGSGSRYECDPPEPVDCCLLPLDADLIKADLV